MAAESVSTGIHVALIAITAAVTALRLVSLSLSGAKLWWDDYVIVLALLCTWVLNIGVLWGGHRSGHRETISPQVGLKLLYSNRLTYVIAMAAIKASVLFFYHRAFPSRTFNRVLWLIAGVVGSWMIAMTFAELLQCLPIQKVWDPAVGGSCIDMSKLFLAKAIPDVITNLAVVLAPVPVLCKLRLTRAQMIALCGLFLMGGLVCVISILRLAPALNLPSGVTRGYADDTLWSTIEPALALISACLPSLPNLFIKCPIHLKRPWKSFQGSRSRYKTSWRPWGHAVNAAAPGGPFERLDDFLGANNGSNVLVESCRVHSVTNKRSIPLNAIHVQSEYSVDRDPVPSIMSVDQLQRPNKAAV